VDSWNLYYGCLKGTPYRWINIAEMARRSMPAHYHIDHIRFFTATSVERPEAPQRLIRQLTLFRALRTLPNLTMHFGLFRVNPVQMLLVNPLPDGTRYVEVVRTEEMQADELVKGQKRGRTGRTWELTAGCCRSTLRPSVFPSR
jgi:hypothetical protein